MTQEEIQAVKDTGVCHEQALNWSYYETSGVGYASAICQNPTCFTKYTKTTAIINLDEV
jgi:hypothetical protein